MKSAKMYEQEQLMRGSHTIATWVALQRMYRRRTKSGLGRFLNVHPNTITYWEKGGSPKYYHLKMMARYWDIDVSQIIVDVPKKISVIIKIHKESMRLLKMVTTTTHHLLNLKNPYFPNKILLDLTKNCRNTQRE